MHTAVAPVAATASPLSLSALHNSALRAVFARPCAPAFPGIYPPSSSPAAYIRLCAPAGPRGCDFLLPRRARENRESREPRFFLRPCSLARALCLCNFVDFSRRRRGMRFLGWKTRACNDSVNVGRKKLKV